MFFCVHVSRLLSELSVGRSPQSELFLIPKTYINPVRLCACRDIHVYNIYIYCERRRRAAPHDHCTTPPRFQTHLAVLYPYNKMYNNMYNTTCDWPFVVIMRKRVRVCVRRVYGNELLQGIGLAQRLDIIWETVDARRPANSEIRERVRFRNTRTRSSAALIYYIAVTMRMYIIILCYVAILL